MKQKPRNKCRVPTSAALAADHDYIAADWSAATNGQQVPCGCHQEQSGSRAVAALDRDFTDVDRNKYDVMSLF